jgi:hypothetical protein
MSEKKIIATRVQVSSEVMNEVISVIEGHGAISFQLNRLKAEGVRIGRRAQTAEKNDQADQRIKSILEGKVPADVLVPSDPIVFQVIRFEQQTVDDGKAKQLEKTLLDATDCECKALLDAAQLDLDTYNDGHGSWKIGLQHHSQFCTATHKFQFKEVKALLAPEHVGNVVPRLVEACKKTIKKSVVVFTTIGLVRFVSIDVKDVKDVEDIQVNEAMDVGPVDHVSMKRTGAGLPEGLPEGTDAKRQRLHHSLKRVSTVDLTEKLAELKFKNDKDEEVHIRKEVMNITEKVSEALKVIKNAKAVKNSGVQVLADNAIAELLVLSTRMQEELSAKPTKENDNGGICSIMTKLQDAMTKAKKEKKKEKKEKKEKKV